MPRSKKIKIEDDESNTKMRFIHDFFAKTGEGPFVAAAAAAAIDPFALDTRVDVAQSMGSNSNSNSNSNQTKREKKRAAPSSGEGAGGGGKKGELAFASSTEREKRTERGRPRGVGSGARHLDTRVVPVHRGEAGGAGEGRGAAEWPQWVTIDRMEEIARENASEERRLKPVELFERIGAAEALATPSTSMKVALAASDRIAQHDRSAEDSLGALRDIDVVPNILSVIDALWKEGKDTTNLSGEKRFRFVNHLRELVSKHVDPSLQIVAFQNTYVRTSLLAREAERLTLTRAYEESQMREVNPQTSERGCFYGAACDAIAMSVYHGISPPLKMKEFLYPSDQALFEQTGRLPETPGECLMCMRAITLVYYITLRFDNQDARTLIAPHWVKCNEDGEYRSGICFMPEGNRFMGITQPCICHDWDLYACVDADEPDNGGAGAGAGAGAGGGGDTAEAGSGSGSESGSDSDDSNSDSDADVGDQFTNAAFASRILTENFDTPKQRITRTEKWEWFRSRGTASRLARESAMETTSPALLGRHARQYIDKKNITARTIFDAIDPFITDVERTDAFVSARREECVREIEREHAWVPWEGAGEASDAVGGIIVTIAFAIARLQAMQMIPSYGELARSARHHMAKWVGLTREVDAYTAAMRRDPPLTVSSVVSTLASAVEDGEHALPSIRTIIVDLDFWTDSFSATSQTHERMTEREKLFHLMRKGIPRRCFFRCVSEISTSYCTSSADFRIQNTLMSVIRCSLMGLFRGASGPFTFEAIRNIDRLYTRDNVDGTHGARACRHHYILYHALKEWLVTAVAGLRALRTQLAATYNWVVFEHQVLAVTDNTRIAMSSRSALAEGDLTQINAVCDTNNERMMDKNMFHARRGSGFEMLMTALDSAPKKRMKRKENGREHILFSDAFDSTDTDAQCESSDLHESGDVSSCAITLVEKYGIRPIVASVVKATLELYHFSGCAGKTVRSASSNTALKSAMAFLTDGLRRARATAEERFGIVVYAQRCVRSALYSVTSLDHVVASRQRAAMQILYGLPDYPGDAVVQQLGRVPVCLVCGNWTSPVVTASYDAVCGVNGQKKKGKRKKKKKKKKGGGGGGYDAGAETRTVRKTPRAPQSATPQPIKRQIGVCKIVYDAVNDSVMCGECIGGGKLHELDTVGTIVRVGGLIMTRCTICGSVMPLRPRAHVRGCFACALCEKRMYRESISYKTRFKSCVYTGCDRPPNSGVTGCRLFVVDDVPLNANVYTASAPTDADVEYCAVTLCKKHASICRLLLREAQYVSHVSRIVRWIDFCNLYQKKTLIKNEAADAAIVAEDAKRARQRNRFSGTTKRAREEIKKAIRNKR